MQKKLLLLLIAVNGKMFAEVTYDAYKKQQTVEYQKALVNDLAGNEKAIDNEDQKNKQVNDDEEKESKKQQYDGTGYWVTQPSTDSAVGREFHKIAQHKQEKNKINQDLSEITRKKRDKFNQDVLPDLAEKFEKERFFIADHCVAALRDCGTDLACYDEKGLSHKIATDVNFGSKYEQRLYTIAAHVSSGKEIGLTSEEIKRVLAGNPKTKEFIQDFQGGVKELSQMREDISNSKK
jgi:hypothetical protein